MKKVFLLLLVFIFIAPVYLTAGTKEEVEQGVDESVDMEGGDEIDPWILEVREPYMKYLGSIPPSFRGPTGRDGCWNSPPCWSCSSSRFC